MTQTLPDQDVQPDFTAKPIRVKGGINNLAFDESGSLLATSDAYMQVKAYRGAEVALHLDFNVYNDKVRPTQRVRGLEITPDGSILYVAAADTIYAVDTDTGREVWSYVPPRFLAFLIVSPNSLSVRGDLLAASFDNGSTGVWDRSGTLLSLWSHNDSPRIVRFLPDGEHLVGTDSFSLTIWDWRHRKRISKVRLPERVYGMAASPSHPFVATRGLHDLHLWDMSEGKLVVAFPVGLGLPVMQFHPRERLLAVADRHLVTLYDFEGNRVSELAVDAASVFSLAFDPSRPSLTIGCSDGELRHWNY